MEAYGGRGEFRVLAVSLCNVCGWKWTLGRFDGYGGPCGSGVRGEDGLCQLLGFAGAQPGVGVSRVTGWISGAYGAPLPRGVRCGGVRAGCELVE